MTVKNVALIGNQNCGKTTLFNLLTGSHQYVGNWPGVTVDRVEGRIAKKDISIVDLPGLYSLSPYSPEEVVSRNYLLTDEYDVILNIVDASHLERSLSLTLECAAFNKPMVIALNMIDLLDKSDISVDIEKLSKKLGIEVVKISAVKNEGIDELVNAIENAKVPNLPSVFGADVETLIDDVASSLEPSLKVGGRRFVATALLKDDDIFVEEYKDKIEIMAKVTKAKNIIKEQSSIDAQSFFPKKRYEFIDAILDECRVKKTVKSSAFSEALDKIVLNRFLALPIFLVVVGLVYFGAMYFTSYLELIPFANDEGETEYATITDWVNDNFFGGYVTDLATALCESAEAPEWLQSLAIDGVVGGVGAVLGFLPQIAFLFLFLSFLEQSGYMTRVAFVLDRIFRSFGMSGRNFIPMVIATGCGVPALMANKTIDNINERRIGLITTTFIPCSAKLPIMTMIFASVMDGAWWFAPFVYGMSIFSIIVTGLILKKNSAFKEEVSPFVMEIPDYHMPTLRNILKEVYNRCKAFVVKAGTVIFTVVVVVWFLANFGMGENGFGMVEDVD
ncbi:MAG: ferrous iron transport protein B, partial [Succinivibrio sp.]